MSSTLARMTTPVVIVFMVAYGASALVLFVCASVGFGQGLAVRIIEGIGGLLCLANAAGVPFADRVTVCCLLWFAAPIAAPYAIEAGAIEARDRQSPPQPG
jgi:hypothetical protein